MWNLFHNSTCPSKLSYTFTLFNSLLLARVEFSTARNHKHYNFFKHCFKGIRNANLKGHISKDTSNSFLGVTECTQLHAVFSQIWHIPHTSWIFYHLPDRCKENKKYQKYWKIYIMFHSTSCKQSSCHSHDLWQSSRSFCSKAQVLSQP